jgi:hypothetical protein
MAPGQMPETVGLPSNTALQACTVMLWGWTWAKQYGENQLLGNTEHPNDGHLLQGKGLVTKPLSEMTRFTTSPFLGTPLLTYLIGLGLWAHHQSIGAASATRIKNSREGLHKWSSRNHDKSCDREGQWSLKISWDHPRKWRSIYFTTFLLRYGQYINMCVLTRRFLRAGSHEWVLARYSSWGVLWKYNCSTKELAHTHAELIGTARKVHGSKRLNQAIRTIYTACWTDEKWTGGCKFFGRMGWNQHPRLEKDLHAHIQFLSAPYVIDIVRTARRRRFGLCDICVERVRFAAVHAGCLAGNCADLGLYR